MKHFLSSLLVILTIFSSAGAEEFKIPKKTDFYTYGQCGGFCLLCLPGADLTVGTRYRQNKFSIGGLAGIGTFLLDPYVSVKGEVLYYLNVETGRYCGLQLGSGYIRNLDTGRYMFIPTVEIIAYGKEYHDLESNQREFYQFGIIPLGISFDYGVIF